MKTKNHTGKVPTGIKKATNMLLTSGILLTAGIQESKGQWGMVPGAGRTIPIVQKIGVGFFPTNPSIQSKLHVNQFLLASNPATDGFLFRTDGNSAQNTMWQLYTGTSATAQTEKFRIMIPANSNDVLIRATQAGATMQFQTTGPFIGGGVPITRMTITDGLLNGFVGIGENFVTPQSRVHQHELVPVDNFHQFTNSGTGNTATDGLKIGIDAAGNATYNQFENLPHIWKIGNPPAEWMRIQHGNVFNNFAATVTNGYVGLNQPNPFFHLMITTPAVGGGELMLGAQPSDVANSQMGLANATSVGSRFLPTFFGRIDNTQPGPAIQTLGSIDNSQDLAPGVNNLPVHRFVVGKNWNFNMGSIQNLDTIKNRVAFTWQNANVIKMMMNADGQVRIGASLLIPATLPNNRVEITASVNDPYNSVIPVNGASGLRFTHLTSLKTPLNNGVNGIDTTKVLSVDQNGDVVLVRAGGGGLFKTCAQGGTNLVANSLVNMNGNSLAFDGPGNIYIGDVLGCSTLPSNIARVFIRNTFGAPPNPTVGLWVESNNVTPNEIALVAQNTATNMNSLAARFIGDVDITGGLTVSGIPVPSDQLFKVNINPIQNASSLLLQIQPVTFYYDTINYYGFRFTSKKRYGFIAQQVEQLLPEIVDTKQKKLLNDVNGQSIIPNLSYKTLDYNSIIAIVVEAFKEQQSLIDSLINKDSINNAKINQLMSAITTLSNTISSCCSNNNSKIINNTNITLSSSDAIVLNQNAPNPFAERTVITYYIPEKYNSAQIIFTTVNGQILKTIDVSNKKSHGQITVYADDLSSGMYIYYLVVDGKTIETKRMEKQ